MTRLYAWTSDGAAGTALAALSDITDKTRPALPAAASTLIQRAVGRELVTKLDESNITTIRKESLDLLATL